MFLKVVQDLLDVFDKGLGTRFLVSKDGIGVTRAPVRADVVVTSQDGDQLPVLVKVDFGILPDCFKQSLCLLKCGQSL